MAVKVGLTEAEYLRTSFPGVDSEFRDGELVERAMPDFPHSNTQMECGGFFRDLRKKDGLPFYPCPELRHQVRPGRYLIPDVAVHWPNPPAEAVPSHPPLIVIEVLSLDDRMSEVLAKFQEYVAWGVPHVWLIDPRSRQLSIYDRQGLRHVEAFPVPEANRVLGPSDIFD
jgi:Uma2 family endonuclease